MKITVIGATGFVGKAITSELLSRSHEVTGIARNIPPNPDPALGHLTMIAADVFNVDALAVTLKGTEVVVSAYNGGWDNPELYNDFIAGSQAIQAAVSKAGVKRYIVIGGAGSLYLEGGVQVVDMPEFPKEFYAGASAARDYHNLLKGETGLDWAFFSPPFEMNHVTTGRTGKYRLGTDFPVFDENKKCALSVEDVAVVIADEIDNPRHHQTRFTAGY